MPFSSLSKTSLARRIFTTMLAFVLIVIVAVSLALTGIFFNSYETAASEELGSSAESAAAYLEHATPQAREEFFEAKADGVRYTLIASDGTVLYDNAVDANDLGNHADRPEVKDAASNGEATLTRYSETLGTDTMYAAVELSDGSVLRLAETRHSLVRFLSDMLLPMLVTMVIAAAVCLAMTSALVKRILKPIDALDFTDPLDNQIYDEMKPLLGRIDAQQRRLREQNTQLEQAQNMRRDFSSNVSHEMKTPLQVISGYAELIRDGFVDQANTSKFAGLIYDEAQDMRHLIDDVLTLSKLDASALDDTAMPVDVVASAQSMNKRLAKFARDEQVTVTVDACTRAVVLGNDALIDEMVHNLIENGIRYNEPGGSVTVTITLEPLSAAEQKDVELRSAVEAEGEPKPERAEIARLKTTAMAVLRVADTGRGIPPEYRDRVFQRFFRVEKSRSKETGGTGLGLAIVKHAVEYHHGSIEVLDNPGGGTIFEVRIPAYGDGTSLYG